MRLGTDGYTPETNHSTILQDTEAGVGGQEEEEDEEEEEEEGAVHASVVPRVI
jgi:hypothetical protein